MKVALKHFPAHLKNTAVNLKHRIDQVMNFMGKMRVAVEYVDQKNTSYFEI
jgi:hypothetical protein